MGWRIAKRARVLMSRDFRQKPGPDISASTWLVSAVSRPLGGQVGRNKLSPVISSGLGSRKSSSTVGATSARRPLASETFD